MQADALCVKVQGGQKVWVATAISVFSRLFLWGEVSTKQGKPLTEQLMAKVRAAAGSVTSPFWWRSIACPPIPTLSAKPSPIRSIRANTDLFWTGSVYNFCTIHASFNTTPAMVAGLTEHVWSVEELLRLRLLAKPLHEVL